MMGGRYALIVHEKITQGWKNHGDEMSLKKAEDAAWSN